MVARAWGDLVADLGADLGNAGAWLMHLSPHDVPEAGRAALVAAAVAGVARVAGRNGRLGAAAGALGLLAGWGVLGASHAAGPGPGEAAWRLAAVAAAVIAVLVGGDAVPRRARPVLPFALGAASGWWLAGAPLHGARLLHGVTAAALLGAATDVAARRLGRGAGASRGGGRGRKDTAPASAGPEGVVVLAAALSLCGGLMAAGVGAGAFAAALVAAAVAAALLPGPDGVAGLATGVLAAGMAAALGQGHWLRLPVAEDWAADAAALSPLVVVALGGRLARRWGAAGPCGAAAVLGAAVLGLARWR